MASDEIDREEVDRLVKQMAERRKAVVTPAVTASQKSAAAAQQTPAPQGPIASTPASQPKGPSRWSSNRLLMPALNTGQSRKAFAFASAIHLPALPKIGLPEWTDEQLEVLTARMFVALGVALGIAMPYWPYRTANAWSLGLYLAAVVLEIVTGIWGSKLTWDARLARAHTVSIVTVMWGLGLIAAVILRQMGMPQ